MQTTSHPQFQIIEDSPTKGLITTCGFITLDNDPKSMNRRVGFALVEVDPAVVGFSVFKVWELASLPIDNQIVNEYILAVNEQKQIQRLHIDMENFLWFNGKQQWNQSIKRYLAIKEEEKKEAHKQQAITGKRTPFFIPAIPPLRPLGDILGQPERGKDPLLRQVSTLQGTFDRGEIQLNEHLKANAEITAELAQVGKSVVCDALAGAIYKAKDLQRNLRNQFGYKLVQHELAATI